MSSYKQLLSASPFAALLLYDEPMSLHTTFRVGGPCDALFPVSTANDIATAIAFCKTNNIPLTLLGNGSNTIVTDNGIDGLVIMLGDNFSEIKVHGDKMTAQAGALMPKIGSVALENSLTGFEPLSGIPGTVGGAVFMNAGAYDSEICIPLLSATVLNPNTLEIYSLSNSELDLSYRHSLVMDEGLIVLDATLQFKHGDSLQIKAAMDGFTQRRRDRQPLSLPSAGSTFKRPEGHFAGQLIESSGLKGMTIGGAQVSTKHAGFIVNIGNATAKDILLLIEHVQATVLAKHGVVLHPEVRIIGR